MHHTAVIHTLTLEMYESYICACRISGAMYHIMNIQTDLKISACIKFNILILIFSFRTLVALCFVLFSACKR